MLKRIIGMAIVVLAAWGSGCTSAPAPEAPVQYSAIKFVMQEESQQAGSAGQIDR